MKNWILICCIFLTGCAGMGTQRMWLWPPGGSMETYLADRKRCEYEAKLHVRTPSQRYATEIGAMLDINSQRRELVDDCLKAKGYELTVRNVGESAK